MPHSPRGQLHRPLLVSWRRPGRNLHAPRHHSAIEQHIQSKGVAFTWLYGSAFLEVLGAIIGADGVIRGRQGQA
jgi:hypothetical protein